MNKESILFIVEGESAEPIVLKKICTCLNLSNKQIYSYKTNIFRLYQELKTEYGDIEDVNVLSFIQEIEKKKGNVSAPILALKTYQISEIYLLFDLDAHVTSKTDENLKKIEQLIEEFDNETGENGKLIISYPMLESIVLYDNITDGEICFYKFKIDTNRNSKGQHFKAVCNTHKVAHHLRTIKTNEDIKRIMTYHLLLCKHIYGLEQIGYMEYKNLVSTKETFRLQKDDFLSFDRCYLFSGIAEFILNYSRSESFPEICNDIQNRIEDLYLSN